MVGNNVDGIRFKLITKCNNEGRQRSLSVFRIYLGLKKSENVTNSVNSVTKEKIRE